MFFARWIDLVRQPDVADDDASDHGALGEGSVKLADSGKCDHPI